MSVLDDLLKAHRRRIIEREEGAFRELLAVYRELERDLKIQYKEIEKLIRDAKSAGEEITPSWIARSRRLKALIDQVKTEVVRFGGRVTGVVSREQEAAIRIAATQTREAIDVVGGQLSAVGSLLPRRTIENAVGMMGDGSPMMAYFEKTFAPAVAEKLRSEIVRAAALGTDFRTIARRLVEAGDITRHRALTMARTEVNRVRRATTLEIYRENENITGWEWVAAKSERTCVVCLALDGQIFDIKDGFPQHINCRCTMIAVIRGVERPARTLGKDWFDRQTDEVKEKILGTEAAEAYKRGEVTLADFIGRRVSREFGESVYTKSLSSALLQKAFDEVGPTASPSVIYIGESKAVLSQLLGREIPDRDVATLIGALDDSMVRVETNGISVGFAVRHPRVQSQIRYLQRDEDGDLYIYNSEFFLHKPSPPGLGTTSFSREVFKAAELKIKYIKTFADGDYDESQDEYDPRNGYYTWPRLGYNAPFNDEARKYFESLLTKKRKIYDINDLMKTADGRDAWLLHGSRGPMIFRLDGRSKSMRTLKKYLIERNAKKIK